MKDVKSNTDYDRNRREEHEKKDNDFVLHLISIRKIYFREKTDFKKIQN